MAPNWRQLWRRYACYVGLGLAIAFLSGFAPWGGAVLSLVPAEVAHAPHAPNTTGSTDVLIVNESSSLQPLPREAIALANDMEADDLAAFWYWQEGRLLAQLDRKNEAIAAYCSAIQRIGALGQDLVAERSDIQRSYRNQVESIYRQLLQLLLEDVDAKPKEERQQLLVQARDVIEALQVAELQNYFRAACQTADLQSIERIDPKATVIYPILLSERLDVIVSTPGQVLHHYSHELPIAEAQTLFQSISAALNLTSRPTDILAPAQRLYDLLLRPGEDFFQHSDTIVFVLDGFLRNVPMAILHDGQQFLVESYQLALTPGLQLLHPQPLMSDDLRVLTGGISEARQGFSALPGVQAEVSQVASSGRSAKVLLNQQFTEDRVRSQLQITSASVVHLATHGQFSSKPAETFLLTWDDRLTLDDIEDLLTQKTTPVELLILSACETAAGDNQAVLGMAGIAVRSGARSTLATLWPVQDDSTALMMTTFYQQFLSQEHRAEALQQAQQSLLHSENYHHPFYWAPYVLVGHWQ